MQFTPPGSPASIHFGKGVTSAAPGSAQGLYPRRLRHRGGARRSHRPRRRGERGLPRRRSGTAADPRPGSGAAQLLLVRHVQRSGRQHLAVAGGHRALPRTRGRRTKRRSLRWPTWRARSGARRPRTASTRSGPADGTMQTGRTGTPSTWWRSRPARSCRSKSATTSRSPGASPVTAELISQSERRLRP